MTAPQAVGVIHSDFEKGFIRAETIVWSDVMQLKRVFCNLLQRTFSLFLFGPAAR
ncbi:hypothetical protein FH972_019927 [Carpinus fangiana]|uniref:YchF C-terminal domain-containing protein n=1 Tax=Carpinus fangiana TaxID=176857 RepID=A0A5N6RS64_9ROSI|nr:hypothetical protein FH972_019927 [Carpinus fangiana]